MLVGALSGLFLELSAIQGHLSEGARVENGALRPAALRL